MHGQTRLSWALRSGCGIPTLLSRSPITGWWWPLIMLAVMLTIFKLFVFIIRLHGLTKGLWFEDKTTRYNFHYTWQCSSCDYVTPVYVTQGVPTGLTRSFQVTRLPLKVHLHRAPVLHCQIKEVIYNVNKYFLENQTSHTRELKIGWFDFSS